LILSNATVLDVVAGGLVPDRHVRVVDGKIAEIADRHLKPVRDEPVIDLRGRTLMPGLIDCHVHVTAATADLGAMRHWAPSYVTAQAAGIMRGMLERGFTTVRDVGGADFGLARAVAEGALVGPRLLFCGKAISQTGGHGDARQAGEHAVENCGCCAGLGWIADGVTEVRKAAREQIRTGAHHIKIMASGGVASPTDRISNLQYSVDEIAALVDEAEAAGIYVAAHAYTARSVSRALEGGVRTIEHGNLIDQSNVAQFKRRDAFLVPTLVTYDSLARDGLAAGLPRDSHAKLSEVLEAGRKALEMAHRGGVKLAFGSDLLGSMHKDQLREFAIRGEIQPPIEVIRAATANAAALLRREGEIGIVAEGARADLLVVDGDPLRDLGVLQSPEKCLAAIVKEGAFVTNRLG